MITLYGVVLLIVAVELTWRRSVRMILLVQLWRLLTVLREVRRMRRCSR